MCSTLAPTTLMANTIDGEWTLVSRRCASQPEWETVPSARMSINLMTGTHSLKLVVKEPAGDCTMLKIGRIEQVSDSSLVFCKPVSHLSGVCSKNMIDHVLAMNNYRSECTDERKVLFSNDGNKMQFSETIKQEGFACPVGEDLIYNFERILTNRSN